ncbi:hypothetical protein ARTHRO_11515 [Limnospira indica PCC 8005]|uniref:Uncharacterized protein n=1 Tax=Limnospira indica PCC 8005 TaxID=376219 RepID=A0A9P1NXL3_9CYAN|nr:hypothetical protein ARTHRO_11515 [Limnospira indica PCC 8005]
MSKVVTVGGWPFGSSVDILAIIRPNFSVFSYNSPGCVKRSDANRLQC